MASSDNREKLQSMLEACENQKSDLINQKRILRKKRENCYGIFLEDLKKEMDSLPNNKRLQDYLERTATKELNFLYNSINIMPGNNQKGQLSQYQLLLFDDNIRRLCLKHNLTSESAFLEMLSKYGYDNVIHPILENAEFLRAMEKVTKLACLDEIFQDLTNILNYQGSYVTYRYVKNYLRNVLNTDVSKPDDELVYKDYDQKLSYVLRNLSNIASHLLEIRNQIPNSRISVCNLRLSRVAKRLKRSNITDDQRIFASSIAFGTTLEKLKDENYEDAESLIYVPHQRILK